MKEISYEIFKDEELLPLLLVLALLLSATALIFSFFKTKEKKPEAVASYPHLAWYHASRPRPRWNRQDFFVLAMLMVFYGTISSWKLGSTVFPSSTWQPVETPQSLILELTDETHFDSIYSIYCEGDNNANLNALQIGNHNIQIDGSQDGKIWEAVAVLDGGSLYQYSIQVGDWDYRYIRLTVTNPNDTLTEIGFKAYGREELLPVAVYEDANSDSAYPAQLLIDEQDKIALDPTYMDESYFDEIYHPRNAWEIANGEFMYATVHPLLGTSLIALSIHLFGMNPYAWRLPGMLTGILLIPLFYSLIRELFDDRRWAAFGAALLSVEFMHLTTSRIATLEPFSVFWIVAMFIPMVRYYNTNFFDAPFRRTLKYLFLSGLLMGLGMATKWTACYSAIGLAILLFTTWIQRWREYKQARKILADEAVLPSLSMEEKELCQKISASWRPHFWTSFFLCFLFFIGIPLVIYWGSYLWCPVWRDGWSIAHVAEQNEYMYNYHTNLKATHPYQSYWYQWLLDIRPIWYYGRMSRRGVYNSISCFTNPAISWVGFLCTIYTFVDTIRHRNRTGWVIMVGYLTAFLPWVLLVDRCVFAYHFYPTSFFMLLCIVYSFKALTEKFAWGRKVMIFYLIVCTFLFFFFLPATVGFGAPQSFMKVLEWLPTWYFG